jgi:hypothetical protein
MAALGQKLRSLQHQPISASPADADVLTAGISFGSGPKMIIAIRNIATAINRSSREYRPIPSVVSRHRPGLSSDKNTEPPLLSAAASSPLFTVAGKKLLAKRASRDPRSKAKLQSRPPK